MIKKYLLFFLISLFSLHASQYDANVSIQTQLESKWQNFQINKKFQQFISGRSDSELKEEFTNIRNTRLSIWGTSGFEFAEHLVEKDLIRAPGCIAFTYNNTVPYYNASTIYIGSQCYIACEGPRSKDIPKFFNMLINQHVTHLVRLTSSYEGWSKKCHPYWDGLIKESNATAYLNIPTEKGIHSVQAFHLDQWRDHQGINPEELLSLVLQVSKSLKKENGHLAVHCSAGVGRTGTFIAALAIVEAIDTEMPFSIEEIVYSLSLQRIHSVAKVGQYITLHRLAEIYLKQKIK